MISTGGKLSLDIGVTSLCSSGAVSVEATCGAVRLIYGYFSIALGVCQ
jgi:hypothetical protein